MQSSKLFAGKIERFIQNIVKAEERKEKTNITP